MYSLPIYNLIRRTHRRLNALILASATMKGWFLAGSISGTLLIAAKMAGNRWPLGWIWLVICLAGGLAGAGMGWIRRIGPSEAAHWLDRRLESKEAFSAALICLERAQPGPFDEAVLLRADDWTGRSVRIPWPWRKTLQWSVSALGMVTVIGLLFLIRLPSLWPSHPSTVASSRLLTDNGQLRTDRMDRGTDPQSAHALAQRLFPHNPQMARRVEKALREGDASTLENLFKEADWETDTMLDRETASAEPNKAELQKQRLEQQILALVQQNGVNSTADSGSLNGKGKSGRESSDKHQSLTRDPNAQNSQEKVEGQANNEEDSHKNQGKGGGGREKKSTRNVQGNRGRGQQPGKGKANVNKYWGDLTGSTSQTQAIITQRKDGPMLEYVLSGKKIRTPLSEIVPNARRSAESAMSRQEIPGEYEDFVRSYFLKLTQKSSSQTKKGEHS